MNKIRAIIIDDERNARMEISRMLSSYPQVTILGEASDADQAESLIELLKPDLIFLDVQLPGKSGFELLESLTYLPEVIFVTAYDHYAIKAFEVSAADYLMKPVREERFAKAMEKMMEKTKRTKEPCVFIKDKGRIHMVKWTTIFLIESEENYARIYFGEQQLLLKSSLNKLEENPACSNFFRASRSQFFNLDYLKVAGTDSQGMWAELIGGQKIRISERQATKFRNLQK